MPTIIILCIPFNWDILEYVVVCMDIIASIIDNSVTYVGTSDLPYVRIATYVCTKSGGSRLKG